MATFKLKLINKDQTANGTMAFYFEKPEGLTYVAGQHASWRIINPVETDQDGNERTLSFITIPSESQIGLATRIRNSAFKKNLANAQPGIEIEVFDPRGSLILPKDSARPVILLAGGIGITPMISMVKQATFEKSGLKIYLFHSNRKVADTPFLNELTELTKQNSNFIYIPTMTQEDSTNWTGEAGHINQDMISKYVKNLNNTIFYLTGPAGFVNSMMDLLSEMGIDSLFIKTEDFGEYK